MIEPDHVAIPLRDGLKLDSRIVQSGRTHRALPVLCCSERALNRLWISWHIEKLPTHHCPLPMIDYRNWSSDRTRAARIQAESSPRPPRAAADHCQGKSSDWLGPAVSRAGGS